MMNRTWLRRLVAAFLKDTRKPGKTKGDAAMAIVGMTFLSPPEEQWQMVLEAVRQARSDDHLGHIAAGPIEGLLGRHGERCIGWIEHQAAADPKFARAMTGVWKHLMSDKIWARVQALQRRVPSPLPSYRPER
jgi:hypothetical protein